MLSVPTCSLAFLPGLSPPRQTNRWSPAMPLPLEKSTAGPGDSWRVHSLTHPDQTFSSLTAFSRLSPPPPPFPYWLRAVTKGLIPKQGFSNGSVIYLCSSPTWEEQASGQYCSYCVTHLSPPFGPSLLSAHPPHIMLVYRLSLLHTPRGSAACFTLHYFRYHLLISCVCDSLRRFGAPQNNTSFYHVSVLALRQWPLIPYLKHLLPSVPRVRPLCLKTESSRAHQHLKYGPVLQNFSLEWVNITHSSLSVPIVLT